MIPTIADISSTLAAVVLVLCDDPIYENRSCNDAQSVLYLWINAKQLLQRRGGRLKDLRCFCNA